jgi:hypothetical protein
MVGRLTRLELSPLTIPVDICIQTPMKRLEEMHPLAEALDKRAYSYNTN